MRSAFFSTWAPAPRNVCARPWLLEYQGYLIMFFINNSYEFEIVLKNGQWYKNICFMFNS